MDRDFTNRVGFAGEAFVAALFIEHGFSVYTPAFGEPEDDMIVGLNGKLLRVQVKTSLEKSAAIRYAAWHKKGETYTVDWLVCYSLHYGVAAFLKPEEAGIYPTLRYDRPGDAGQLTSRMRYAKDYPIERVIREAKA